MPWLCLVVVDFLSNICIYKAKVKSLIEMFVIIIASNYILGRVFEGVRSIFSCWLNLFLCQKSIVQNVDQLRGLSYI